MIQADFRVFLSAALLLLILPLDWLLAAGAAALVHELCHILVLYTLHGRIMKMDIQTGGCVIESCILGPWREALSILAGPAGSFLLLFLCRVAPKTAICGLVQGVYNLLPVLPLDGGRLLRILLYRFCPERAEKVMNLMTWVVCMLFDLLLIWLNAAVSAGPWLWVAAFAWNLKFLPRKIPCKPTGIGVQ